jgi:hypothetical protein
MATKKPSRGRLTEIVASRRSQGSSVTGALASGIKERLKEKFDPRQLINQRGLLTALFPGLKTYQAKTSASEISQSSMQVTSFDEIKPMLETISFNTKMTAKNTMVLPALHRDVNVIRQNIVKLVKLKGGDARTKADMYFVKAKEREDKYERELKKERNKQSRIQKIKEDEKKKQDDGTKSFFQKLISSIVKGLSSVVSALASLGKAILGAFKFLAGIVGTIFTTLGKAFFGALSGLAGLMPNLKNILKTIVGFISSDLVKILIRSIIGRLIGFVLSPKGLIRIGMGLLAFFAGAFGLSILPEARRQANMLQDKNISDKDMYQQTINEKSLDLKKGEYSELPTSGRKMEGEELERSKLIGLTADANAKYSIIGASEGKSVQLGKNGELTELQKNILKDRFAPGVLQEYYSKMRNMYKIHIPGLNDTHPFLLTKEQAVEYGDKQREYFSALRKLISLQNSASPAKTKLREEFNIIKSDLLSFAANFVAEQINSNSADKRIYFSNLRSVMENLDPGFLDAYTERATDVIMNSDIMKGITSNVEKAGEKFVKDLDIPDVSSIITNTANTARNSLTSLSGSLETQMKDFYTTNIIDKTFDNRKKSVVFKQPIVITQESDKKSFPPFVGGLGGAASAWNNDFIDKHFSDMMSNPLGPFKN